MQQSPFPKRRLRFSPSVFSRTYANIKSCSSLYSWGPCHFEVSTHYCNHRHRLLVGNPGPIFTKSGLSCSYASIKMAAVSVPEILATTDIHFHWRFQSLSPNTPLETLNSATVPIQGILGIYSSYAYANINRCSSLYSPNADFDFHHQCSLVLMRISKFAAVSIPGVLVTLKFQLIIAIIATGYCLAVQVQSPPKVSYLVLMRPSKW